jgi:hypothetical protein
MSLQPYALASLSDFKDTLGKGGTAKDDVIDRAINTASRLIEAELGRRLRYRAPEEVAGGANVVAAVALTNTTSTSLTIAAQPSAARTLIITITDTDRSVKAGTVTVTGTVGGSSTTEVFDLADCQSRYHGRKFFTAVASVVTLNVTGASSADTIAVGTSLGMVEYHDPRCSSRIRLRESPVYSIAEIYEDSNLDYASTDLLTVTTDYQFSVAGEVTRVDTDGHPQAFESGYRAVKVRYSAGYGALSTVPPDIKDLCLRVAGAKVMEFERGSLGMSSVSDAQGNFTRLGSTLTRDQRDELAEYRRSDIFTTTAERDFDEEAA